MAANSALRRAGRPSRVSRMQSLGELSAGLVRALLVALLFGGAAQAAETLDSGLEQQVRQLALDGTRHAPAGVTRVDVQVGQLDPRLRLAPCQKVEPYLSPGTRLWGRARIGLRCTQGPSAWNVFLPVTVRIYGRALVAAAPLSAGSVIGPSDV